MGKILNIGHRGAMAYEPENTIRSVRKALECGVDMVEIDVHGTKDGRIVVIHDETLERTTNGKGKVKDFTLEEIRKLDAGKGERIPTLEEVIEEVKGKAMLNIEIKAPGIEREVVEILQRLDFKDQVLISSFSPDIIERVKVLNRDLKAALLLMNEPYYGIALALSLGAQGINPYHLIVTSTLVNKAHQYGLQVNVWTVNGPYEMDRLINMGVDGIITNTPDALAERLRAKGLSKPNESNT